jgi:uncharacterized membrane protein
MVSMLGAAGMMARFGGMGGGRGPLWMLPIMFVVGLIFVALFLWIVYMMVRYFYRTEVVPRKYGVGTPIEVAQRRFAAGEITGEEFDAIKQRL